MNNELLNKLNESTVKTMPVELKAFVKSIEQKTAGEVYGDEVKNKSQPVFIVVATNDDHGVSAKTTLPYYEDDNLTALTKMGKWKNTYGKLDIGAEVTLMRAGNYYEVVLN